MSFTPTLTTLALAALASVSDPGAGEPPAAAAPRTPVALGEPYGLLPRAVTSFGSAATGGWVYVLGGYAGTPHRYSRDGQPGDFYRLSTVDPRDLELLPRWHRTQGTALVARGGRLYAAGGLRIDNAAGEPEDMHSLSDSGSFDPERGEWTPLPAMPAGRSSHDAAFVGGVLCVAGGWSEVGEPDDARWHDTLLMLDVEAGGGWVEVPAPFRRRALAVAATDELLVVVGGMDPRGLVAEDVELFDPATGTWTKGPEFPERGFGVAAAGVGDVVYASGADGVLWSLRPGVDDAWRREAELFAPRFFHRLVADGGDLLVLGGIQAMDVPGRIRVVERLERGAPAAGPPAVAACFALPAPGLPENRHAGFVRGGELHLFGGNRTLDQHDFSPAAFAVEGRRLNLQTLRWSPAPDLPVPRQSMATALVGDAVGIAAGGFGHDGEMARSHADVLAYDFEEETWSRAGALARPRTQFLLVEHGGSLWAFGGLDFDPRRAEPFELVLEVERAPAAGGDFEPAGVVLPEPRRAFGGALLDGSVYLVGGMREDFEPVETCRAFDLEGQAWRAIAAPARPRVSPDLVAHGGRLYLCGGLSRGEEGDLRPDPTVEVYDPAADAWTVLATRVPAERVRHARFFASEHGVTFLSTHGEGDHVELGYVPVPRPD